LNSSNRYLDAHATDFIAHVRSILTFKGPFGLAAIGLAIVALVFVIRAYFTSEPAIVGTADLMLQELDISDLEIAKDKSSCKVNAAGWFALVCRLEALRGPYLILSG
jgi:hypothetical protein